MDAENAIRPSGGSPGPPDPDLDGTSEAPSSPSPSSLAASPSAESPGEQGQHDRRSESPSSDKGHAHSDDGFETKPESPEQPDGSESRSCDDCSCESGDSLDGEDDQRPDEAPGSVASPERKREEEAAASPHLSERNNEESCDFQNGESDGEPDMPELPERTADEDSRGTPDDESDMPELPEGIADEDSNISEPSEKSPDDESDMPEPEGIPDEQDRPESSQGSTDDESDRMSEPSKRIRMTDATVSDEEPDGSPEPDDAEGKQEEDCGHAPDEESQHRDSVGRESGDEASNSMGFDEGRKNHEEESPREAGDSDEKPEDAESETDQKPDVSNESWNGAKADNGRPNLLSRADDEDAMVRVKEENLSELDDSCGEETMMMALPVECDLQEEPEEEDADKEENGASESEQSSSSAEESDDEYKPRAGLRRSRHLQEEDDDLPEDSSEDVRQAYRLFQDVLSTAAVYFLSHPSLEKGVSDYMDIIAKPIWLEEIRRKFLVGEYPEVEDFAADLRLLLENCYRYYGPDNVHTRRALKIEQKYYKKVEELPKEIQHKYLLDPDISEPVSEENKEDDSSNDSLEQETRQGGTGNDYRSALLERVGKDKEKREGDLKGALVKERLLGQTDEEQEKIRWENETLFANGTRQELKSMWEIPQLSQILQLTRSVLCIDRLPQYEVERMLLMPQASRLLAVLMTSLLSPPAARSKLHSHHPMPYAIWSKKLAQRVAFWYKTYNSRNKNPVKVFEHLGIECEFWLIMGEWNQLEDYEFHELSFHQRVWVIKSLCDHLLHHHKTMHDFLAEYEPEEQMCSYLGEDGQGRQYLHFPVFCRGGDAVRVYRQRRHIDNWAPQPEEQVKKNIKKPPPKRTNRWARGMLGSSSRKRKRREKKEKPRILYDFHGSHFISRNTYRMPYSMHAGRKSKKRRNNRLNETNQSSDKAEPETSTRDDVDRSATNSPEASQDELPTRSLRSTRNKYQANYLDWSESDDADRTSPDPQRGKRVTRASRAFAAISESSQASKAEERSIGEMEIDDTLASVPGSSVVDDGTQDASFLSDEGASRSSLCKDGKTSVKENSEKVSEESDMEEEDEDDMPDISPTKIEEEDDDSLWLTKSSLGKKATRRPKYDPVWLLQGTEYFELVADSIEGIRALADSLTENDDDMDLMHRINDSDASSNKGSEQKLKQALYKLARELEPVQLRLEQSARLSRNKLYKEFSEWKNRPEDFVDSAETYWLSLLEPVERAPPILTPQVELVPLAKVVVPKTEKTDSENIFGEEEKPGDEGIKSEANAEPEKPPAENEGRSTRRSKRRVDFNGLDFQNAWPDEMSSEEEGRDTDSHDDSWEMPSRRKRKRVRPPRKRPPRRGKGEGEEEAAAAADDDNNEKDQPQPPKRTKKRAKDKTDQVKKRLWSAEGGGASGQADADKDKDKEKEKEKKRRLKSGTPLTLSDGTHSKLTLDKQGNLFITMSSGERVPLEKDEEGRIQVPSNLPKFSVLNGKTLQQLFGENRVIPKPARRKECSTTLFPALPLPAPTPFGNMQAPNDNSAAGTSSGQTPKAADKAKAGACADLLKMISDKVTVTTKGSADRVYPPATARSSKETKKSTPSAKKDDDEIEVIGTSKKAPKASESVVYLSDGSDDSIEVLNESAPIKPPVTPRKRDGIPRIQNVVGNAKIDLPPSCLKNLSKSVTMSPVVPRHVTPTKNMATPQKDNQWKPVITGSRSLKSIAPAVNPQPGSAVSWNGQRRIANLSPEVQITATRKQPAQRNLSVYRTPNQAFVPVTTMTARPAQAGFVPVNQFVATTSHYNRSNQFQPVTQLNQLSQFTQINQLNQFVPVNTPSFMPLPAQSVVQVNPVNPQPPRVRMLAGNTTITPIPSAPSRVVQTQSSPALSGQIVLVNTDKGFTYAVKLADGGTIFLTPEQVAKIREANSGKLTTMVTLHTN